MIDYTAPERDHCALVLIDAQRDYIDADSPVRSAECSQTVEPLGRLVSGARAAGTPIFHMVRYYRADASNVDLCRRKLVEEGMRVLMPGSLGAEPLKEVAPDAETRLDPYLLMEGGVHRLGPREEAIYKPRWGAFYDTVLAQRLKTLGITTLVVAGFNFATSGRATLLEASERDFRLVAVPDAAAGLNEQAQRELCRVGVHLLPAETCVAWLKGERGVAETEAA